MVDLDGHVEYSKTIAMKLDCSKAQLLVYPNPVIDILNVNITNLQGVMTAKLFDSNGRLIYTGKMTSGSNTINMSTCPKGMYLLQLIGNDQVQNIKITK
jgi:glucuronoarabinoxylan endo-1,4-beta-xylanase